MATISLARARLTWDGGTGLTGTGGATGLCRNEEGEPEDVAEAAQALLEACSGAGGAEAAQALLMALTETRFESLQPAAKETTFGSLGFQDDEATERALDKMLGAAKSTQPVAALAQSA